MFSKTCDKADKNRQINGIDVRDIELYEGVNMLPEIKYLDNFYHIDLGVRDKHIEEYIDSLIKNKERVEKNMGLLC